MMMTQITVQELEKNLDFLLDLVQRGHTFKIYTEGQKSVLLTSINNPIIPDIDPIETNGLPMAPNLVPESEIRNYVHESLEELNKSL